MANYFNPDVDLALNAWLGRNTWDSVHPRDEAHFYYFVKALSTIESSPDLEYLVEKIVQVAKDHHPKLDEASVVIKAKEAVKKADIVFAFLRAEQYID